MAINLKKHIFNIKTKYINHKIYKIHLGNNNNQYATNIDELNFQKRLNLIKHAYNHTIFYRNLYNSLSLYPDTIKIEDDFLKLPIIKREDIKNNFNDFISNNVKKKHYYKATTVGSTGQPLSVLHDKRFPLTYLQWRVLNWWAIKPYENSAYIYRLRRTGIDKIFNTILWWPTKRIFLNASEMNNITMLSFIQAFNKIKPILLQGYVGAIYEFALFIRDNNIKIESPKAVWVTSAPLTEQQRLIMQAIFKAPVYDQYGTCEIMWLAAECKERNGLHIMSDARFIEFVDDNYMPVKPNTWGRILLTDLYNYAFPLIRYEIGDRGRLIDRQCECGVRLPLMDKVKGRISDIVKTPSGLIISGEYLTTIFDDFPNAVKSFQLMQHKDKNITLKIIPNYDHKSWENEVNVVINKLEMTVKHEIKIKTDICSSIPSEDGKTRFIISE